jgi:cytochrome c oxidase subunit I+III
MARPGHEQLDEVHGQPPGLIGWLSAVNHKAIGLRFIVTAFGFFLIAGADSLVIRAQLAMPAEPGGGLVNADTFAQLFTTHGTAMMFLFAIPMVEGLGMYFVPLMIGARDMAFPRLNALGYWLYLFGGLLLYSPTIGDIGNFLIPGDHFPDWVPDGGWFNYPPLTSSRFSPDFGIDFWLLGVTLAEISAVIGAVELVATILKMRAPGMAVSRVPIFVWSILVVSFAILFALPAIIAASTMLELERKVGMPFYDPLFGGDPILWQHLFWFFGHPEVYIMFLPATGIVSMVIPAFTGRPLAGYTWVVAAIIATAFLSFGLWVHHMFAIGLPWIGLGYFSAASMMITFPSGVQVFAWIATLLRGPKLVLNTAMLFVLGFIVTFVAGGVTGVMVASVPFDLQVHDTYFVVAHFHYVIVGGVVLPIFAGFFYWFPKVTGRILDERLGKWFFWLFFIGLNVAFLPMHNVGLLGMLRRVYRYDAGLGWEPYNLAASIGAAIMAAGVLVFLWSVWRAYRGPADAPSDPWGGGTLEWSAPSPPPVYNFVEVPSGRGRYPLWDLGAHPVDAPTSAALDHSSPLIRETLGTTPLDARPSEIIRLPRYTIKPFIVSVLLTGAVVGVLFDIYLLAAALALATLPFIVAWLWPEAEDQTDELVRSAGDLRLPMETTGYGSTPWWGVVLLILSVGMVFISFVGSYFYLAFAAEQWPPPGADLPSLPLAGLAAATVAVSVLPVAGAWVRQRRGQVGGLGLLLAAGALLGLAGAAAMVAGLIIGPFTPGLHAYDAATVVVEGAGVAILALGIGVLVACAAQARAGLLSTHRIFPVDAALWIWVFAVVCGLIALATGHLAPHLFEVAA